MTRPLLLDCDPGHDDAIAILLALASPEVDVQGITTVAGNQTLERTTRNALVVLVVARRDDVPVARGASAPLRRELQTAADVHGESGLDGAWKAPEPTASPVHEDATAFLTARSGPEVAVVATGPLTNLALALERGARMERPVWMGGGVCGGDVTPEAEFNAFVDPEAAQIVFDSGVEPTMVGLDVTHRALVAREHHERLRAAGSAGRFVAELLDFYGRFHRDRYGWDGTPVHDALALAVAIDPSLVHTEHVHVRVHTGGRERGRTELVPDEEPNAHVALDVDAARFLEVLCSRIERLP